MLITFRLITLQRAIEKYKSFARHSRKTLLIIGMNFSFPIPIKIIHFSYFFFNFPPKYNSISTQLTAQFIVLIKQKKTIFIFRGAKCNV